MNTQLWEFVRTTDARHHELCADDGVGPFPCGDAHAQVLAEFGPRPRLQHFPRAGDTSAAPTRSLSSRPTTGAFSYIEVREGSLSPSYAQAASDAYWSALLDHNATHRAPAMTFFRRETPRDREWDTFAERLRSDIDISGTAYPDRNGGRGEIWISAEHTSLEALKVTVFHEIRHIVQPEAGVSERERDAHEYARNRPDMLTEIYGPARRSA